ncbi:hypothetical protein C8F04DRAFT_693098 [Mycena alexandri]|uniref:Uncharacterized protein n=1 Tax=Mycena alexandri TaxID=1745969 RepID=A0AAD6SPA8_9AGAR|nr:hypothetical protein C8F04DRAFT_693098 [Mycena alexandri]
MSHSRRCQVCTGWLTYIWLRAAQPAHPSRPTRPSFPPNPPSFPPIPTRRRDQVRTIRRRKTGSPMGWIRCVFGRIDRTRRASTYQCPSFDHPVAPASLHQWLPHHPRFSSTSSTPLTTAHHLSRSAPSSADSATLSMPRNQYKTNTTGFSHAQEGWVGRTDG